jgi:hypothetical protein
MTARFQCRQHPSDAVHTTDSLLIARLHASSRQSTLAKVLHEYGWLADQLALPR